MDDCRQTALSGRFGGGGRKWSLLGFILSLTGLSRILWTAEHSSGDESVFFSQATGSNCIPPLSHGDFSWRNIRLPAKSEIALGVL